MCLPCFWLILKRCGHKLMVTTITGRRIKYSEFVFSFKLHISSSINGRPWDSNRSNDKQPTPWKLHQLQIKSIIKSDKKFYTQLWEHLFNFRQSSCTCVHDMLSPWSPALHRFYSYSRKHLKHLIISRKNFPLCSLSLTYASKTIQPHSCCYDVVIIIIKPITLSHSRSVCKI